MERGGRQRVRDRDRDNILDFKFLSHLLRVGLHLESLIRES